MQTADGLTVVRRSPIRIGKGIYESIINEISVAVRRSQSTDRVGNRIVINELSPSKIHR